MDYVGIDVHKNQSQIALIGFQGLRLQRCPGSVMALKRPLKNKGMKEGRVTTMRLDDLGKSTTLKSNKSQMGIHPV
jgi:hypothetical protein